MTDIADIKERNKRFRDEIRDSDPRLVSLEVATMCNDCVVLIAEIERLRSALDDVVMAHDLPGQHCEMEQAVEKARRVLGCQGNEPQTLVSGKTEPNEAPKARRALHGEGT
jgi:hypothetical protein